MSAVAIKTEKALKAFLESVATDSGHPLHGFAWFEGHGKEDMNVLPRGIITCSQGGGPLAHAGIYEIQTDILLLAESDDTAGQEARPNAVVAELNAETLEDLKTFVNKPASGPDERPADRAGYGLSGLVQGDPFQTEGRDEEKNQHGSKLSYKVWAHLEDDEV